MSSDNTPAHSGPPSPTRSVTLPFRPKMAKNNDRARHPSREDLKEGRLSMTPIADAINDVAEAGASEDQPTGDDVAMTGTDEEASSSHGSSSEADSPQASSPQAGSSQVNQPQNSQASGSQQPANGTARPRVVLTRAERTARIMSQFPDGVIPRNGRPRMHAPVSVLNDPSANERLEACHEARRAAQRQLRFAQRVRRAMAAAARNGSAQHQAGPVPMAPAQPPRAPQSMMYGSDDGPVLVPNPTPAPSPSQFAHASSQTMPAQIHRADSPMLAAIGPSPNNDPAQCRDMFNFIRLVRDRGLLPNTVPYFKTIEVAALNADHIKYANLLAVLECMMVNSGYISEYRNPSAPQRASTPGEALRAACKELDVWAEAKVAIFGNFSRETAASASLAAASEYCLRTC